MAETGKRKWSRKCLRRLLHIVPKRSFYLRAALNIFSSKLRLLFEAASIRENPVVFSEIQYS